MLRSTSAVLAGFLVVGGLLQYLSRPIAIGDPADRLTRVMGDCVPQAVWVARPADCLQCANMASHMRLYNQISGAPVAIVLPPGSADDDLREAARRLRRYRVEFQFHVAPGMVPWLEGVGRRSSQLPLAVSIDSGRVVDIHSYSEGSSTRIPRFNEGGHEADWDGSQDCNP